MPARAARSPELDALRGLAALALVICRSLSKDSGLRGFVVLALPRVHRNIGYVVMREVVERTGSELAGTALAPLVVVAIADLLGRLVERPATRSLRAPAAARQACVGPTRGLDAALPSALHATREAVVRRRTQVRERDVGIRERVLGRRDRLVGRSHATRAVHDAFVGGVAARERTCGERERSSRSPEPPFRTSAGLSIRARP